MEDEVVVTAVHNPTLYMDDIVLQQHSLSIFSTTSYSVNEDGVVLFKSSLNQKNPHTQARMKLTHTTIGVNTQNKVLKETSS